MSQTLDCADIQDRGMPERYVAGALSEEDRAAFEEHFLLCEECQEDAMLAAAVRGGVTPESPRGRVPFARIGLALAAAAAVAFVFLRPGQVDPDVAALGAVDVPPVYLGVPVRTAASPGDSLFRVGMDAYQSGRYQAALDGLDTALAEGADPAPGEFFRGVSLLLLDRPEEAAAALLEAANIADSPYSPEARYYRAKALLRLGRSADALAELNAVGPTPSAVAEAARTLAAQVEEMVGH